MKNTLRRAIVVILVLCMAAALCVVFAACDNDGRDSELRIGLECAYSPFNYTQLNDENGAVKIANADGYANGYDVMIAKRIADSMGKKLVIYQYEWDALVPAVVAGTLDFVIAGMSPTEERLKSIDFSEPYYESNLVVVVRRDGKYADAESLSDLTGATLIAQPGTFHDDALSSQGGAFGINRATPIGDFPAMINALNIRAVDGYIAEEPGAIENCASNPDFTYIRLKNNDTGFTATAADTAIAVGMKKGNSIKAQIDEIILSITQSERQTMMERAIALASGSNVVE